MAKIKGSPLSPRQIQLETVVGGLQQPEKEYIKANYLDDLSYWASLLDRAESLHSTVEKVSDNIPLDKLQRAIDDFNGITRDIERFSIDHSNSVQHVKNRVLDFKGLGRVVDVLEFINIARATGDDTGQAAQLKALMEEAKLAEAQFRKSFHAELRKQQRGATRTLARHYEVRIKELMGNESTNPELLLEARNKWMVILGIVIVLLTGSYIWLRIVDFIPQQDEAPLILAKVTLLFLISSHVYFKQRNFNIYSDLIARYKHMHIIASTITDFSGPDIDQVLKEKLINSGVETMFTKIDTGHLKQSDFHNREQINNIIGGLTTRS